MVSFDSHDAGTPESAWVTDERLAALPPLDLGPYRGVLVIAAHPDDETLGAGGLIARAADAGLPVHVVVATGGAPDGDPEVIAIRRRELADAIAELAPEARVTSWDYLDAATGRRRDELFADLAELLDATPADWLIAAPWPGDGHHDHEVVGAAAAEAAAGRPLVGYPIWMWHWADPGDAVVPWPRMTALPVDPAAKDRALRRYRSQTEGDDPMLRADVVEHFRRDTEVFVVDAVPVGYFDRMYDEAQDPWGFADRWYEERKRAVLLASLPRRRFVRGLELGCSIGVTTEQLVERVDDLLATDISASAVERARQRVGDRARVEQLDLRDGVPDGPFDLVVLSEVGYYLEREPLRRALRRIRDALAPDGVLVACHWRHPVADYPLTGDDVHAELRALGLARLVEHIEDDFVLEVLSPDPRSVAAIEGLT